MSLNTQLGVKAESTWGTAVTVDRFFEYNSESITMETERIESKGLRASTLVQRSDRFVPVIKGAAGSIELEVLSKGFGFWLEQCLGTVGTTGPADTTAYTHTGTVGSLLGQGFTLQVNRPLHPAGTNQAFTYEGGKVAKWSLYCDVDGLLMFSADLVFETGVTATALATASYPTAMEHLSWAGGAVTIDGTATPVESFKVEVDNGLMTDRYKLRSSTLRQEPVESNQREITWELVADFESLAQYNRAVTATATDTYEEIIATWTGPTLISGAASTYPSVQVKIDQARFDSVSDINESSTEPLKQTISGRGLYDGSTSPVTVIVVNGDSTA